MAVIMFKNTAKAAKDATPAGVEVSVETVVFPAYRSGPIGEATANWQMDQINHSLRQRIEKPLSLLPKPLCAPSVFLLRIRYWG